MKNRSLLRVFVGTLLLCFIPAGQSGGSAPISVGPERPTAMGVQSAPKQEANQKILVEIFLAPDRKGDLEAIKKEFGAFSITKVRTQFFKLGNPPENIAIGKNIPADVARLAIRLALSYNRGIKLLLPEERLHTDYIAIGTSIFDESFQRPIAPEQLKQLLDPSLTTDQFHALYRQITGEDQRKP